MKKASFGLSFITDFKIDVLFFLLLLPFLILTRFFLVNENALFFFPDESRFVLLEQGMRASFYAQEITPYLTALFSLDARPGYGLLYGPAVFLVALTERDSVIQLANIVIVVLSCIFLYLIIKKIFFSVLALISAFFYFCSLSSVTYIRHALPYDGSILFFLLSLYATLQGSYFLSGVLFGFSFTIYPGIYFSVLPMLLFLLLLVPKEKRKKRLLVYVIGFFSVLLGFEITSRLFTGTSYVTTALKLSGTITQGDFMPAVIFYAEYVFANDGVLGVILGFSGAIITGFLLIKKRYSLGKYILLLFWLIVVNYLFYELMTFILQRMVLYGRTVRPFYIMNIILSTAVLSSLFFRMVGHLQKTSAVIYKIVALIIVVLLVLLNYYPRYSTFVQLEYPDNFVASNRSLIPPVKKVFSSFASTKEQVPDIVPVSGLKAGQYYFVNTSLLYPYYGLKEIGCKEKVLIERLHILGLYGPYAFEGFNKKMRGYLRRNPPVYQLIYCESVP